MKNFIKNIFFGIACCVNILEINAFTWHLSSINAENVLQGYGTARINRSVDGNIMQVGGVKFENGVGTHAESIIVLELDGNSELIWGKAGVDDEMRTGTGSVKFKIINADDGTTLWESSSMTSGMTAEDFKVKLNNMKKIYLIVTDDGNGIACDHADWLDVKIQYNGNPPQSVPCNMNVDTEQVQWRFLGVPGGKLRQTGMGKTPVGDVEALITFPQRDETSFLMSPNLKIMQGDGSYNLELIFRNLRIDRVSNNVTQYVYCLEDPVYHIAVNLIVTAYRAEDVFTSQIEVANNGDTEIVVFDRDGAFVALPAEPTYITSFNGNAANEFTGITEDKASRGIVRHQVAGTDRTAVPDYPGVFLSFGAPSREDTGTVFAAAIAWSGSWQYQVTRLPDERIFFSGGALEDPIKLYPEQNYISPLIVMTWSNNGKGQASRNLHRYMRNYGIPDGYKERPVVFNSWTGVSFDFDEAKILRMMDGAAALGAEIFVLDDGWFGNEYPRNNDSAGLGDWQVNTKKLPGGIENLIKEAHRRGLKFGLWVEPEMVNPASNLYKTHPEWVMRVPGRKTFSVRNQYLLDLSRPEVEEFVFQAVSNILSANPGIDYIKWDHNGCGMNPGAAHLGDNQGALSDKHNQAYYRIMYRLRKAYPHVMFQLCASGGCRIDFGAMKYHEEFWASDETNGILRIPIQWGISHFMPANTMASHIIMYGDGDFKLRADVAMTGRLGIELNPELLTESDIKHIKQGVAAYKELRPLLHAADLYRGRSPFDSRITEYTFVAPDKKEAVFFVFKRDAGAISEIIKMKGLNPNLNYSLTEINPDETPRFVPAILSGRELMETGMMFEFPDKESSAVVKLMAQ